MAPKAAGDAKTAAAASNRQRLRDRMEERAYQQTSSQEDDDSDGTSSYYSSVSEDSLPPICKYGHTYHGSGRLVVPNDKYEMERLGYQHELFKLCLDGRLCDAKLPIDEGAAAGASSDDSEADSESDADSADGDDDEAGQIGEQQKQQQWRRRRVLRWRAQRPGKPVSKEQPPLSKPKFHILDVGAGTGQWACEMGQTYPSATVLGIDLSSAMLPKDVPPNVTFEIADAAEPWSPRLYDFIHLRNLVGGGVRDWPKLLRDAYAHLKPGGQLEFSDVQPRFLDADPAHFDQDAGEAAKIGASCLEFQTAFAAEAEAQGVNFDPLPGIGKLLTSLGAEHVRERTDLVPVWGCAHDPIIRRKGELLGKMFEVGLANWTLMLFGNAGWKEEDIRDLIQRVTVETRDPKLRSSSKVVFITARKPEIDEEEEETDENDDDDDDESE